MAGVRADLVPPARVDGNGQEAKVDLCHGATWRSTPHSRGTTTSTLAMAEVCQRVQASTRRLSGFVRDAPHRLRCRSIDPLVDVQAANREMPMVRSDILPVDRINCNLPLQLEEALQTCASQDEPRARHIEAVDEAEVELCATHSTDSASGTIRCTKAESGRAPPPSLVDRRPPNSLALQQRSSPLAGPLPEAQGAQPPGLLWWRSAQGQPLAVLGRISAPAYVAIWPAAAARPGDGGVTALSCRGHFACPTQDTTVLHARRLSASQPAVQLPPDGEDAIKKAAHEADAQEAASEPRMPPNVFSRACAANAKDQEKA
eukprot:CAMPEP_0180592740 /NCGR_PEP_ID=MMETSP1037_2-20121125/19887_1 /TAXON_ID=632150 /ORGANISM="Azadinium spinosum, Strain 3D9" /LENGTH=316 /DNA_ID=CAMNT_0022611091 /DNA_START=70 /DNA_END=1024 /DNA_ORIENTATION=-